MISIPLNAPLNEVVLKQLRYKIRYHFPEVREVDFQSSEEALHLITTTPVMEEREVYLKKAISQMIQNLALINRKFRSDLTLTKHKQKASSSDA